MTPPPRSFPTDRSRSVRDVLAAVASHLGFQPSECVVVAAVTRDGRLAVVTHLPLAGLVRRSSDVRRTVGAELRAAGARQAVLAVYTSESGAGPAPAVRRAVDVLLHEVETVVPDAEPWLVTKDGFRGLGCIDPLCCPPGGHPLPGWLDVVGAVGQDRFGIMRAPEQARSLAGRAACRWHRAMEATGPDAAALRQWRRDGYATWQQATRNAAAELAVSGRSQDVTLPASQLGRLAVALGDTSVRDAVLLSLVPGAGELAERTASAGDGTGLDAGTSEAVARIVDPRVAVPPDERVAGPARVVLEAVVGHTPRRHHAPPLTLLALLAWWSGDGALARVRVDAALATDGCHRLAVLLRSALSAAVPPGWVRRGTGAAGDGRQAVPPSRQVEVG